MGVVGTGLAAAVAQSGLQSQQVARERDKRTNDRSRDSDRVQDLYEKHLKVLEEGEQAETAARLVVDENLPEHERHGPDGRAKRAPQSAEVPDDNPYDPDPTATAPKPSAARTAQLYRHLDIQA